MSEATTVAFDESGNTGPDLLNPEQPVFVLASVSLSELEAIDVLGLPRGHEHHSVSSRRSPAGQSRMLRVLESPALNRESVKIAVMHKPFVVTTKLVDLVLEPLAAENGFDLYQQGLNLSLSNLFHATWPVLDPVGFDQVMRCFLQWVRRPSPITSSALGLAVSRMASLSPEGIDLLMRLAGERLVHRVDNPAFSKDISDVDPAVPALVGLLHEWCFEVGAIRVLHDDSSEVRRLLPILDQLRDPTRIPIEVQVWNGTKLRYPLPVDHIAVSNSAGSARIQLADLVAGAAAPAFGSYVSASRAKLAGFTASVLASTLPTWVIDASIWPTHNFLPEQLGAMPGETEWLVDRLTSWGAC